MALSESIRYGFRLQGRNTRCHCGSGRKYKVCCMANEKAMIDKAWPPIKPKEGTHAKKKED